MKNEDVDIQRCGTMETYANGEETSLVFQETRTGANPRLMYHLPDCSLEFDNDLDVFPR